MSIAEFISDNLYGDPLIDAFALGIMFVAFIEFFHILASLIFSMFKK